MTHWKKKDIENLQGQGFAATTVDPISNKKAVRYAVGIDPGTKTGIAFWDCGKKKFISVETVKIHIAMEKLGKLFHIVGTGGLIVRFEDARLRTWFGEAGPEQLQGAGSIKRDCTIWEDVLISLGIIYEKVPPKRNKTKVKQEWFKQVSGWEEPTNEHGRDAAMLVLGY